MPKLWDATIDEHRRAVQTAILDATAELVFERGLAAVTMSLIAQRAGIGRATLYKYFPDVETIVTAWHERQVTAHLAELTTIAARTGDPAERVRAVLHAYATMSARPHGDDAMPLHRAGHVQHARQRLHALVTETIGAAARAGAVRADVPAAELASYCLHALGAASAAPTAEARERLVAVTLSGLK